MDLLPGDGMEEAEKVGVKEIPAVAGEAGEVFQRLAGGAVEGIAGEGMADGGEVDSNLVGTAGVETHLEYGCGGGAGDDGSRRL